MIALGFPFVTDCLIDAQRYKVARELHAFEMGISLAEYDEHCDMVIKAYATRVG